jgi:DNA-binding CsgD family transcriptional regulator/tetratricopeptide (TPR) repeat protein
MPATRTDAAAPFIGRGPELATLRQRLDQAARHRGGVILIAGEPGIGKTRLAAELSAAAADRGLLALTGRSYESDARPPYLIFAEALHRFVTTCPLDTLYDRLGARASLVALALPDLRSRMPSLPPVEPADPEEQRYRLFEAVTQFVLEIARGDGDALPQSPTPTPHPPHCGLLLVLDDLHWADGPALRLLHHLARRLSETSAPLLVLGTYRTADAGTPGPLADIVSDLRRGHLAEQVELGPLSADETSDLVAALTGAAPAPAVAQAIYRDTAGNPFFVEEITRSLIAEGVDPADPQPIAREHWRVPAGIRQAIGRRLARLSAGANRLLQAGAVLGDGFTYDLAVAAMGETESDGAPDRHLDALDEALAAGVLREEGDAYHFTHPLIRQTLDDALSAPRRQRLHLHAAEAIERAHMHHVEPHLAALATHFRLGGPAGAARAVEYSERAGEAAWSTYAFEDATAHWRAALALLDDLGGDPRRQADLLVRLGRAAQVSGLTMSEGVAHFEQAIALYEEIGDAAATVDLRLDVAGHYASPVPEMDVARAQAHLRAAAAYLRGRWEDARHAHLHDTIAFAAVYAARTEEGLIASQQAMTIAERLRDERRWSSAAVTHAYHLAATGRLGDGFRLMQRSGEAAERAGGIVIGVRAVNSLGHWRLWLHDPRTARDWFQRAVSQPHTTRGRGWRQVAARNVALALIDAGDLVEARRLLPGAADEPVLSLQVQPHLAFWEGDWEAAEAAWLEAVAWSRTSGDRWALPLSGLPLARLHRVRGEHSQADALLVEILGYLGGQNLAHEVVCRTGLALIAAETGRPGDARPHLARCCDILANGEDWCGLPGRTVQAEAAVAAAEGRVGEAEAGFERAAEIFRRFARPWDEAETLLQWGGALRAAGLRGRATVMFDGARDLYRRHGAGERWLERVRAAERGDECSARGHFSPTGGTRNPRPHLPEGLTLREAEILSLIAAGRSNQEIADTLVLSVRTVERHITNLYAKIGARNRADAAMYALRHELGAARPA